MQKVAALTKIKILSPEVSSKIAAGEVIERPSSVVKELIENSLDANATKVYVQVETGGKTYIRVSDNGLGMNEQELTMAVKQHATSKISTENDLFNISSFGFRGEALPSILSISEVEIRSCRNGNKSGEQDGVCLTSSFGQDIKTEPIAALPGTTVIVTNLFANVPARKKFLRRDLTELSRIRELVEKFILSFPKIEFKLLSSQKEIIHHQPAPNASDDQLEQKAIETVFGTEICKSLLPLKLDFEDIEVSGFTSDPRQTFPNRKYQLFFVNNRMVYNYVFSKALNQIYRDRIPRNVYPAAFIKLKIKPTLVDINVHPTKKEVKFSSDKKVLSALATAIESAFTRAETFTPVETPNIPNKFLSLDTWTPRNLDTFPNNSEILNLSLDTNQLPSTHDTRHQTHDLNFSTASSEIQPFSTTYTGYILAFYKNEFVIIDQHAAQERLLYNQFKNKKAGKNIQQLLVPETIELSHQESSALTELIPELKARGFEIEPFGEDTFVIRAIPANLKKESITEIIKQSVGQYLDPDKELIKETPEEKLNKILACKAAVKITTKLSFPEIKQLCLDVSQLAPNFTCPHGRPFLVPITTEELEKKFKRV